MVKIIEIKEGYNKERKRLKDSNEGKVKTDNSNRMTIANKKKNRQMRKKDREKKKSGSE